MKTLSLLFNDMAIKKADFVIKEILRGGYSDPPGPFCGLYFRKTNICGRYMVEKDGLWIYRSMIGNSLLESVHQNITKSFGHTMAGVLYINFLLTLMWHHMNWKAYQRN